VKKNKNMELLVIVAVAIGISLTIVRAAANARSSKRIKVRHRILGDCEVIYRIDEEFALAFCLRDRKEHVIDLTMTDELQGEVYSYS
jgi:hypothetical protein